MHTLVDATGDHQTSRDKASEIMDSQVNGRDRRSADAGTQIYQKKTTFLAEREC